MIVTFYSNVMMITIKILVVKNISLGVSVLLGDAKFWLDNDDDTANQPHLTISCYAHWVICRRLLCTVHEIHEELELIP